MITIEKIRKKLIEAIKQSGLTQTEISKRINISQSTIAHYIKGDIMPALDTFANLCAVIDADPADILCVDEFESTKFDPATKNKKKTAATANTDSFNSGNINCNNNSGNINFNFKKGE